MEVHRFSVSIDGSNDTALKKINPMVVRIYDTNAGRVATKFLDMCTSRRETAEVVYEVMDRTLLNLLELAKLWSICTPVGVDNTSVNIGARNSLKTRIVPRNTATFFSGCPCNVSHNAAQKAGIAFGICCGFDAKSLPEIYTIGSTSEQNTKMNLDQTVNLAIKSTDTRSNTSLHVG